MQNKNLTAHKIPWQQWHLLLSMMIDCIFILLFCLPIVFTQQTRRQRRRRIRKFTNNILIKTNCSNIASICLLSIHLNQQLMHFSSPNSTVSEINNLLSLYLSCIGQRAPTPTKGNNEMKSVSLVYLPFFLCFVIGCYG